MNNKKNIYVIQKHFAKNLHFDLRLEINGVLKSWAIPKTPPAKKGVKRLAIQTEDHSIDYADFEGVISKEPNTAESVEIWDKGTYEIYEKEKDKILIHIKGKKLVGRYCLIRLKDQEKNWLFFKY
ncbi:MAG: DNA polymerase ligase N-terminal domain-containing protein [Candidatus Thermoplasmatota archaeon]|jgi:DNA ligase D-like protein (predicted 3'-phosphoesterase)|nr:DNA polymerase ligase N-terminal domain-containing protein [Candidatus Thermoplasmatota archaeon]